ncbi:hypothetical protein JYU34_008886 [Plutella xylostella]|uniref:Regulatory protein zeste n=1 Tax=Plutella xylostella TaxID=51655 RepID=A0ABQ7QM31_PLUXY|nr:hypothetical protein JYU34_008886 [Plutella xylostella]
MSNNSPRPTMEQVLAMLSFMEEHPNLALGKMKGGVENRAESKKLWIQLARSLNAMPGPNRSLKSWMKFWSDKKSNLKLKVQTAGGDPSSLLSNIEWRIWDNFLSKNGVRRPSKTNSVNVKRDIEDDQYFDESNELEPEPEEPEVKDFDEKQTKMMEKLVVAMGEQAAAVARLAQASAANAHALSRLAEASQLQARAIERLANTFENVTSSTHDVRNALLDMDITMKRFYASPT